MSLSKISSPEVFGPGWWGLLHLDAFQAVTRDDIEYFVRRLRPRLAGLPCARCRVEALSYLDSHPIEPFMHINQGLFLWTFFFHNAVNNRLGKRELSEEEAIEIWSTIGNCENCGPPDEKPASYPSIKFFKRYG